MNYRKYTIKKEELIEEGARIVKSSPDKEFTNRVTLVNLLLNGADPEAIAAASPVTTRTLSNWMKTVATDGFEALHPGKSTGRPTRLTDTQNEEIKFALSSDPQNYGYNVWDGPTLSNFIMKKYNVTLGVRSCQKLLHKLGFSLIRPQTFPAKGDEKNEEREEFKKK